MKVIAQQILPDSGSVRLGPSTRIGYFAQEQDTLDNDETALATARSVAADSESDIRTFLHRFLFSGQMVQQRIGDLSYGERARLMLALLVLRGSTVLLLDEPLNHLDLDAREQFEQALEQFDGTIVLVSHDRYTIQRLASRVVEIRDGRLTEIDPGRHGAGTWLTGRRVSKRVKVNASPMETWRTSFAWMIGWCVLDHSGQAQVTPSSGTSRHMASKGHRASSMHVTTSKS